jgi:hypothetical protein
VGHQRRSSSSISALPLPSYISSINKTAPLILRPHTLPPTTRPSAVQPRARERVHARRRYKPDTLASWIEKPTFTDPYVRSRQPQPLKSPIQSTCSTQCTCQVCPSLPIHSNPHTPSDHHSNMLPPQASANVATGPHPTTLPPKPLPASTTVKCASTTASTRQKSPTPPPLSPATAPLKKLT